MTHGRGVVGAPDGRIGLLGRFAAQLDKRRADALQLHGALHEHVVQNRQLAQGARRLKADPPQYLIGRATAVGDDDARARNEPVDAASLLDFVHLFVGVGDVGAVAIARGPAVDDEIEVFGLPAAHGDFGRLGRRQVFDNLAGKFDLGCVGDGGLLALHLDVGRAAVAQRAAAAIVPHLAHRSVDDVHLEDFKLGAVNHLVFEALFGVVIAQIRADSERARVVVVFGVDRVQRGSKPRQIRASRSSIAAYDPLFGCHALLALHNAAFAGAYLAAIDVPRPVGVRFAIKALEIAKTVGAFAGGVGEDDGLHVGCSPFSMRSAAQAMAMRAKVSSVSASSSSASSEMCARKYSTSWAGCLSRSNNQSS
ncbi:hypothetical protein Q3G72_025574 [Acer saccharum]|nr:hypothetical protein Q3G72_008905 [Acer saccharum]KAK1548603.1 hypothetical protein Q3G72_025574 [Acer saccharum]